MQQLQYKVGRVQIYRVQIKYKISINPKYTQCQNINGLLAKIIDVYERRHIAMYAQ